jgi:hypothetical protein
MEADKATLTSDTRNAIKLDLEYWGKKLAHYEKTKNLQGIRVAKLFINKYLDAYNDAKF